jgi:ABC-type anion transport system duplicated permease subunit
MLIMLISTQPKELSATAWIALALIVIFIFILNFSLWTALKRKNRTDYRVLHRLGDAIRNPNKEENAMLNELSERVKRLKEQIPEKKEQGDKQNNNEKTG